MRVRVSGSTITAHGDALGTPYVEFPGNEPPGFPTDWTVAGSAPSRVLTDPHGQSFAVELPTTTAPSSGGSGLPSQWTDGGHGDVTATTDDPAKTPLALVSHAGQTAPLLTATDDAAATVMQVFPDGTVEIVSPAITPSLPGPTDRNGVVTIRNPDQGGIYAALDVHAMTDWRSLGVRSNQVASLGNSIGYGATHVFLASGPDEWVMEFNTVDGHAMGGISPTDFLVGNTYPAGIIVKSDPQTINVFSTPPVFTVQGLKVAIGPNGYLILNRHTAPADSDLSAGDMALWFDQTDGAAKLRIKAKSANGTVVTGTVNLT